MSSANEISRNNKTNMHSILQRTSQSACLAACFSSCNAFPITCSTNYHLVGDTILFDRIACIQYGLVKTSMRYLEMRRDSHIYCEQRRFHIFQLLHCVQFDLTFTDTLISYIICCCYIKKKKKKTKNLTPSFGFPCS